MDCLQRPPLAWGGRSRRHRPWLAWPGCTSWWASPWPSTSSTAGARSGGSDASWWSVRTWPDNRECYYWHVIMQHLTMHSSQQSPSPHLGSCESRSSNLRGLGINFLLKINWPLTWTIAALLRQDDWKYWHKLYSKFQVLLLFWPMSGTHLRSPSGL